MFKRSPVYFGSILLLVLACNDTTKDGDKKPEMDHSKHHTKMKAMHSTYGYADSVNDGLIAKDTLKTSPRRTAMATINDCHVHIDYGSPGVKGRTIWGGLVSFDEVWVAGAHMATNISFNKALDIEGKTLEAGTYGLFLIPGKEAWTFILNARFEQHLADEYNPKEDIMRISVLPKENKMVHRLTYSVRALDGSNGVISFMWDRVALEVPFKVL